MKRSRKPPPDGWELIEPTLDELDQKMREGEQHTTRLLVFLFPIYFTQWLKMSSNAGLG